VITYTIIALCVSLVGLLALFHSIKQAPVGFEDERGFHEGKAPRPAAAFDVGIESASVVSVVRAPKEVLRPRRTLLHPFRRSFGHGS
jgi:hypothetical protein